MSARSAPRWRRAAARVLSTKAGSWYFMNVANPIDRRLIPATKGRVSLAPGQPVLVMETVGAKSAQPRRTPLLFAREGDDLILIASAGGAPKHPAWFHNLRANPGVRVWAPRRRSGDYVARVTAGEERERMWALACEQYPGYETYQVRAGTREIPVVALSPKRG